MTRPAEPPVLLGIGGAHVDRRGRVSGVYVPAASNPGTVSEDVGGGVLNALRIAACRGVLGSILSVRGGDAGGDLVARAIAAVGLHDLSVTFLDRVTPSYTALLDREGELIAALADMALYDLAFAKQLRRASVRAAVAAHRAVLCDANLPAEALGRLPHLAADRPLFAIAISPAKVGRLKAILPSLDCLFLNAREAATLAGALASDDAELFQGLRTLGLRRAVITSGSGPVRVLDGDDLSLITPPAPRRVADVTGAGDALAGATIAALLSGRPLSEAVVDGLAAALLTVESAVSAPVFSPEEFDSARERVDGR